MMAPCSVKANGGKRGSRCFWEPVTGCDRFSTRTSVRSRRSRKSRGNRSALRFTAWFNYFRDYDPVTGKYVASDPIGLAGGISTYGYSGGDPVNHSDSTGLLLAPLLVAPAIEEGVANIAGMLYVLIKAHGMGKQRDAVANDDKSRSNIILFPTPKPASYECGPGDDQKDPCERERRRLQGNRDIFMRVVDAQTDPGRRARMLREFAELFNPIVETHNWTCPDHRVEPIEIGPRLIR